jgi:hypothetical protein
VLGKARGKPPEAATIFASDSFLGKSFFIIDEPAVMGKPLEQVGGMIALQATIGKEEVITNGYCLPERRSIA